MEYRILGPFEVRHAGRPITLGGPRQRAVLAALVARANELASVPYLTEAVWDAAPVAPESNLRTYVAGLRRCLQEAGADPACLTTRPSGYVLTVAPDEVDAACFARLAAQGDAALDAGDRPTAAARFAEALALWRGVPLEGLAVGPVLRADATRWEDRSLAVHERYAQTVIDLGGHDDVLADLQRLVKQHPLRERLWTLLLLALYRAGRPAEALTRYQEARRHLATELGVDPSTELRELHGSILRGTVAAPASHQESFVAVTPRQLPTAATVFVGREAELARMTEIAAGTRAPIMVTAGFGGTGKTWLASHWANEHLADYPDGQLYVNLRGFDPVDEPLPPLAALRGFAEALGVPAAAIPADVDGCAALYRSLVAGKRMLVLVDNARSADQVLPLLPGGGTCTVLVTSRHQLTGLLAAHGAHPVALDVFDALDARGFLIRALGAARVAAEPDAVAALLRHCAGLPLALAIITARAAVHPEFPLATLADELRDASMRLAAFDGGELTANLSATFMCSQDALPAPAVRAFGLLSLAPGADIGLTGAANLVGPPAGQTRNLLRQLETANLIQQYSPGRYRMHDLVRLHAAELAQDADNALSRLADFYLHTAASADRLLNPHRAPIQLAPPAADYQPQSLPDETAALAWFEAEHPNLLAAQRLAYDRGWHARAWQLAWVLSAFYGRRGHLHDDLDAWRTGLAATEALADPEAAALAHRFAGRAYGRIGQYADGVAHLQSALALLRQTGDVFGQAHTHRSLAWARVQQGHEQRALGHAMRALRIYQKLKMDVWEAEARSLVGWHYSRLGEYDLARAYCEEGLALHRKHNNREAEANTLDSLGYIAHSTGRSAEATTYYGEALTIHRERGDTTQEANTLGRLAENRASSGQMEEARTAWYQALALYRAQYRTTDAARIEATMARLTQ
ncbi:MAG TPA: BTAD domain-containing putative transcriptional regulator [Pseudonocardiaceae bacterium]|jgi:DNA-binding SARP family transcriptional activator|nr:BTAD domain-containing putative transcriptional regulator [Pseudonocardiaceae bacterium]